MNNIYDILSLINTNPNTDNNNFVYNSPLQRSLLLARQPLLHSSLISNGLINSNNANAISARLAMQPLVLHQLQGIASTQKDEKQFQQSPRETEMPPVEARKMAASKDPPKAVKTRAKKPKDMPKRPLSAYNFFFKDEREKIVSPNINDAEVKRKKRSSKKRVPHGIIDFQELAKVISERWKSISKERREYYDALAQDAKDRYEREKEIYFEQLAEKNMKLTDEMSRKRRLEQKESGNSQKRSKM